MIKFNIIALYLDCFLRLIEFQIGHVV